jgi:hypothetical protein
MIREFTVGEEWVTRFPGSAGVSVPAGGSFQYAYERFQAHAFLS